MSNNNYEKFKDIAAAVQSLVLSVAIVVGGGWSFYVFKALSQREKAEAELADLRKISLDLSIDTYQTARIVKERRGLIIRVKIKNNGTKYLNLDLARKPMAVTRVLVQKDGQLYAAETFNPDSYRDIGHDRKDITVFLGVQPGSTKELSYYVEIMEPGVYMVRFRSPIPKELEQEFQRQEGHTRDVAERAALKFGLPYTGSYWVASTFIEVE